MLDVRVYWALHEAAERRLVAERVREKKSRARIVACIDREKLIREVQNLVGSASRRMVVAALRRLEASDLVRIGQVGIEVIDDLTDVSDAIREYAEAMLRRIHSSPVVRERMIPVPRRTLRFLATSSRPCLHATMWGHLIRCVWASRGRISAVGRCSSRFIAGLFAVEVRNVKRARAALLKTGWLARVERNVARKRGDGARFAIELSWEKPRLAREFSGHSQRCIESPPSGHSGDTESPPSIEQYLPSGSKNQKPTFRRPSGVCTVKGEKSKPDLRRVVIADLRNAARLGVLFDQAVTRGIVRESPCDRLRFFGAAEHALRVGKRNACGLFAAVVRRGLWAFISEEDEDRAVRVLTMADWAREEGERESWDGRSRYNRAQKAGSSGSCSSEKVMQLVRNVANRRSLTRAIERKRDMGVRLVAAAR